MHREIEVISGDGSNLNISPVEEHITNLRPKNNTPKKKVIIPTPIKNTEKTKTTKKEKKRKKIEPK